MPTSTDSLVEERVAQLQEIRRRRNELVTQMFFLLKRKDELGNVLRIDEDDSGLQTFVAGLDLVNNPEVSHIRELLGITSPPPQPSSRKPTPEQQPLQDAGTPHESPVPEASVSPPKEDPPEAHQDLQYPEDDSMEVDAPENSAEVQRAPPSEMAPTPPHALEESIPQTQDSDTVVLEELTEKPEEPPQTRTATVTKSPSPQRMEVDDSVAAEPATAPGEPQAADEDHIMKVESPAPPDVAKAGDVPESPTTTRQTPLPIARLESQQSTSEYVLDMKPAPAPPPPVFDFDKTMVGQIQEEEKPTPTVSPMQTLYKPVEYSLPPIKALPAEYNRKGRKQSKKRDKSEGKIGQDWTPLGLNKWCAVLRANPIHKKIVKATKCVSTRDWNVALTEHKILKTFDRVEALSEVKRWGFRQPKKHRGVGGLMKTHWDYLLEEMKWMRTDFREERKWKLAVAHALAHAVVEWHEAGSLEERVRRGICVLWKRPRPEDEPMEDAPQDGRPVFSQDDGQYQSGATSKGDSTPMNDDNSDDDSDDDQEKEQQDVLDALDPANAIEEALEDTELARAAASQPSQEIQPKVEYVEDRSVLRGDNSNTMEVDTSANPGESSAPAPDAEVAAPHGLKPTSQNPILGGQDAQAGSSSHTSRPKGKSSQYAPIREKIVYSEVEKLFLDLDDFDLVKGMSNLTTEDSLAPPPPPPPPDLSELFPELQSYNLLDVAPPMVATSDSKKKSERRGDKERDDPNRRIEDATYTKALPANEFMYHKVTLLGPLQPAKHWQENEWHDLDDAPVGGDLDTQVRIDDSVSCGLFEGVRDIRRRTPYELFAMLEWRNNPQVLAAQKQRASDAAWTPQDDMVLKQLVDKYPYNWVLIADSFNTARGVVPTDRRTPMDCCERWRVRWGGGASNEDEPRPTPVPSTPMTTRGTKRSMSISAAAAAGSPGAPQGSESKKRRRHAVVNEAIRKLAKKRDATQKNAGIVNQKKPTAIHDTHGQYNKMPRLTPGELSRMKAEKDQQLMLQQQQRLQANAQATAAQAPTIRTPTNGIPPAQGVPQIRTQQVNISGQQQRMNNQLGLANTRIASSQAMQAQAQAQVQARALAQAQAAQAQAQGQQSHPNVASSLAAGAAPALTAHLSPNYNNAARANSTSPGVPQQASPPLPQAMAAVAAANNATSPRPPSAQAAAGMPAQQAAVAYTRPPTGIARYYHNLAQALTPEQLNQATQVHALLLQQQQAALQHQQQQQQQAQQQQAQQQQQHQQNGVYQMPS